MKTLDEALDVISDIVSGPEKVADEAMRFFSVLRDIVRSERVHRLIGESLGGFSDEQLSDPFFIYLNGFIDGVKIGMEMERQNDPE